MLIKSILGGQPEMLKNVSAAAEERVKTFRRHKDLEHVIEVDTHNVIYFSRLVQTHFFFNIFTCQGYNNGTIKHVTVVSGGSLGCEIVLALKAQAPGLEVYPLSPKKYIVLTPVPYR